MKILYVHQFDLDFAGGSGTYLRLVVAALTAAGHEVEVISAHRPDRYGLTTHALPFDFTLTFGPQRREGEKTFDELSMTDLRALSASAASSIEHEVLGDDVLADLVLANHISLPADVARRLSVDHDIPYRLISYGTDTQLLLRDRRYVEWLGPAVQRADRIFAISEFVAVEVRRTFPGADVQVLGGAVDKAVFRPDGCADRSKRVVFVGRLVSEKGVWTLLQALCRLGDEVTLDVIGEGPLMEPLREERARFRDGQLNLLGYLPPDELRDVLVGAAALVVPSAWEEPLGLVVLEAMACGIPVVATAVGGIPEMVVHGRNGLLVEPEDPEALSRAIGLILDDPMLRQRLRDHCLTETLIASHTDLAEKILR